MIEQEDSQPINPLNVIWNEQPLSDDPEVFLKWFYGLTNVQQVLFPTQWLCNEVYNGGFRQYFSNSTALHAPEAIQGFQELGMEDIAALVADAMSIFGNDYPRDRDVREDFLESRSSETVEWNPFIEMDEDFYEMIKIPGKPDLYDDDRFTIAAKDLVQMSS
jgi:hypothetical protein